MGSVLILSAATLLVLCSSFLWRAIQTYLWKPYKTTKSLKQQGLRGEPYKILKGSLMEIKNMYMAAREMIMDVGDHDITPKVLPHYLKWTSQYGRTFFYWWGKEPRLCIRDPEMVKQVLSNKFGFFPKLEAMPDFVAFIGKGLVLVQGEDWVRHRRIVSPAFNMDKLKSMTSTIADSAISMFEGWRDEEIDMCKQLKELTANVISRTAFGSSFKEGKEAFLAQQELLLMAVAKMFNPRIPGMQYLPTMWNLHRWKLEKRMNNTLTSIIKSRLDSKDSGYGHDLLGLMLEACATDSASKKDELSLSMDEVVDECKTFFFAGHETTSYLLTWTVFLLSTNPEWQETLRKEVLEECGAEVPNADVLAKLKLVNMVLLETIRLYSPVVMMTRIAAKDMTLGDIMIPKGTVLTLPVALIHRDKEYWGEEANKFNPVRFENGVLNASKHPNALLAFSVGPRSCVGQNFAMLEAKMVLALMLQRFSFSLSPNYKHSPISIGTLQPQFGLPVIVKPLKS